MLLLIFIVLLVMSLLLTKMIKGTLMCVNAIFNIVWCVFLGISSLNLYGLYTPSKKVYLYAIIVIFIFNIVSLGFGYIGNKSNIMVQKEKIFYNKTLLYLLNIAAYAFSAKYIIQSINILKKHGFFMMRYYTTGAGGYSETSNLLIFQWVVLPIFILTIIVNAINMSKKNIKWPLLVMTILDVGLYVLLFGGRYIIVRFVFITLITYLWFERGKILNLIKNHKIIITFMVVVFFIIVYLTSKRSIANLNFMGNVITYFTGPFTFLSKLLESSELTQPLYGKAVFGGLYNFIYAIIKILFGFEYNGSDVIITSITSQYIRIGESTLYNSLTSIIYPFLCDFGVFGLIIDTTIFAFLCNSIEKKAYKSMNIMWSIIYLYITFVVFDSVLQYDLLGPINSVLLILTIAISYQRNKRVVFCKGARN